MWLALVATIAVILVGGWRTMLYAREAESAASALSHGQPSLGSKSAQTDSPTRVSAAAVVVSSHARTVPASSPPGGEHLIQSQPSPTVTGDFFARLAALSGQAARAIASSPPPHLPSPTPPTPAPGPPGPTPPPPIVVDAAAAAATARALAPTPVSIPDFLPPVRPQGGFAATPTAVRRAAPSQVERQTRNDFHQEPAGATPRSAATPTPTPYRRSSDRLAAGADPSATRTPRPARTPHNPWARRPNGFPTPPAVPTAGVRPTPGGVAYTPPPIRNGDNKWGVGVYKDSNRVLDALKETQPGVILLMDPSEGWAKKVREALPNAFIVGRRYKPEDQQPVDNPEARGSAFADYVAELAVPLRGVVDAWMSYNEVLGSQPSGDYASYNRFQVAFAQRLQSGYGVAAIAANDGSGALDPEDYPSYFADAIRASQFFGVHAYSPPATSSIKQDAEFNVLRYRKIHAALERAGIHDVKMVLTESGLGDGFRQGIASDEQMAADFAWLTAELRKDPYVIGQAAFGLFDATGAWPRFDLTGTAVTGLLPGLIRR